MMIIKYLSRFEWKILRNWECPKKMISKIILRSNEKSIISDVNDIILAQTREIIWNFGSTKVRWITTVAVSQTQRDILVLHKAALHPAFFLKFFLRVKNPQKNSIHSPNEQSQDRASFRIFYLILNGTSKCIRLNPIFNSQD